MSALVSKDYKNTFVTPTSSILEAMSAIDKGALQIALIVDENEKLLGTVTDGDIRRAILAGKDLNESISSIMQSSPVTGKQSQSREELLKLMMELDIRHIPIVNDDGVLTGFETRKSLKLDSVEDVDVILMVGGLGQRLRPLTDDVPKPMLDIAGAPLLERILKNLRSYGFKKFTLCVNYKSELIQEHFGNGQKLDLEISYIHENKRMGTAGALSLLPNKPQNPVLVMNGDILTNLDFHQLVAFHIENSSKATMCVREYEFEVPYGVIQNSGIELDSIVEKPKQSFFVNAGIYVLDPVVVELIQNQDMLDMPTLFDEAKSKGYSTNVFPVREYWIDIGRMEDLEKARIDYDVIFNSDKVA